METYFKLKTFFEFGVPAIIFGFAAIFFTYEWIKSMFKAKLMERLGYKYNRRLGTANNIAYEFQPHWEKGRLAINCRHIDYMKYKKIKEYVKSKEQQ